MLRPGGYAVTEEPERPRDECDTFTCSHCNTVVFVKPKAPASDCGGFCRMCMKLVCPRCADGSCTPFEKKLEQQEARARLIASLESP